MRWRVGPFDLAAAIVVLVVLLLPERDLHVENAYAKLEPAARSELATRVTHAQAALSRDPGDGGAAQDLTDALLLPGIKQHDQALRVAGEAASQEASPTRWRALLAATVAHDASYAIEAAHDYAGRALEACQASPACPAHERSRMEMYRDELAAGVELVHRGVDPRHDPAAFRRELNKTHPTTTFRSVRIR